MRERESSWIKLKWGGLVRQVLGLFLLGGDLGPMPVSCFLGDVSLQFFLGDVLEVLPGRLADL